MSMYSEKHIYIILQYLYWLVVSNHLKNMREHGNLPQVRDEPEKSLKPPSNIYIYTYDINIYPKNLPHHHPFSKKCWVNGLCPKRESKKPPVTRKAATPGNGVTGSG